MTSPSMAALAQLAQVGDLAAGIARHAHHYHGAFKIALAVLALLLITGVIVLVARSRRLAGARPARWQPATVRRPAAPPSRGRVMAGAVFWVLTLEWFAGQAIAQAAWTTPYSLSQDYISDLGVTRCGTYRILGETSYICSPLHNVMNASFVLAGLFMAAGVVLLRGIWPRRPLATAGLVLITLAGVGKIGGGLAPGNTDMPVHDLATLGILGGGIGAVLLGCALWRLTPWQARGFLAAGVAGTVGVVLMAAAPTYHLPAGAFERVASWPLVVWLAVLGLALITSRTATGKSPRHRPAMAGAELEEREGSHEHSDVQARAED
jgi:hypothetical membrane protein